MALAVILLWAGCAGAPPPSGGDNGASAEAAASSALAAMDGGGNTGPVPSSTGTVKPGEEPLWVRSPDRVYSASQYVSAAGYGSDRTAAEKNAFANLVSRFGQNIHADQRVVETYTEAARSGSLRSWAGGTDVTSTVSISNSLDTLLGAEIKDHWFDGKSTYHAVAALEKTAARESYGSLIKTNQDIIEGLTAMTAAEQNSLDAYSRYRLAAAIADMNSSYASVLSYVGAEGSGVDLKTLKPGNEYRLAAAEITKNIPIYVNVSGDRNNRIKSAFSQVLSKQGFRTGQSGSRYVLDVNCVLEPAEYPGQTNKFVRYNIDANLADNGTVLLPWNIGDRSGHVSVEQAENRALSAAEKKIGDSYGEELTGYLSSLLPEKK
ncbi:MAG: LPP20 family lipoprotein [Treponema sp.]|nr:LPP20 family lipoprotein [Treponema sp.]